MIPHDDPVAPRARHAGLDGLRALAVTLVVVYHLFPQWWVRGGFVGVDVFFVISGFLITSLLVREHARTGRIRLRRFWARRARRLLPALVLVLVVCSTAAWYVGGDVLVHLGRQLLGAVTFGYNWLSVAGGADYFTAAQPELFRNLWSLAVEEQFYLLWPLVLPLLLLPARWLRVAVPAALGACSAIWMAAIVTAGTGGPPAVGADVTRAYFGTDSHAFGILLGVALALALSGVLERPPAWMHRRAARTTTGILGAAAVAGIVAVGMAPETETAATFPGALVAASALTAVAIVAGVWPGSVLGRVIDAPPLRWVGDRSYGIYLWHWPLLVLLVSGTSVTPGATLADDVPVWTGMTALGLTLVASVVSYRLVETPVRRDGFRGCARRAARALTGTPHGRLSVLGGAAASVLLIGGTVAAVAAAPAITSGESVVEAGIAALEDQATAPQGDAATAASPEASLLAQAVSGDQVTAVGDSVMLASAPTLLDCFPGIQVDAAVSRSMYAAPGILRGLADAGALRPFVVLALGTNGSISESTLDDVLRVVGPDRDLILVNAYAPRDWIPGVNAELDSFARVHRGVQVADWADAIAPHVDLLTEDRVHPREAGGRLFAGAVGDALARAVEARARLAEFTRQREDETQLRRDMLFHGVGAPLAE